MIALIGSPDPLTALIATTLGAAGRPPLVCRLVDRDGPKGEPDVLRFRIEHLGSFLRQLVEAGVAEVCFTGPVARPRIDPSAIDAETAPLLPRMLAALGQGDDGALRAVLAIFEEAGLAIRAAQDLVPTLLPPVGVLSKARPTPAQEADAARAERVHRLIAPADIGQGVVLRAGWVVAVEAGPGTDWMLRSVRGMADGALFLKAPKRGQDRRVDLPVVGPATIERAREAGISAVVIEARGVMVLQRDACVALADAAGLALWVREPAP